MCVYIYIHIYIYIYIHTYQHTCKLHYIYIYNVSKPTVTHSGDLCVGVAPCRPARRACCTGAALGCVWARPAVPTLCFVLPASVKKSLLRRRMQVGKLR